MILRQIIVFIAASFGAMCGAQIGMPKKVKEKVDNNPNYFDHVLWMSLIIGIFIVCIKLFLGQHGILVFGICLVSGIVLGSIAESLIWIILPDRVADKWIINAIKQIKGTPVNSTSSVNKPNNRNVVVIDNSSIEDNFITNKSGIKVSIACSEMFGHFTIDLLPNECKRVTFDVKANVYPFGDYSFDNLKYKFGKREKWVVLNETGELQLNKSK
jgi:hypothetical protein